VVFLLATLILSLWLGFQAVDAARSHRRTAEGAMADYAGMAVWEYSRLARENLDSFNRWLFDDVPRTVRRRPPSPDVMANDLRSFLRSQNCECRRLLEDAWFFRVGLLDSTVVAEPDTVPAATLRGLRRELLAHRRLTPDIRNGILVVAEGPLSTSPTMVVYEVARNWEDEEVLAYGVVAETDAFGELFQHWYQGATLLPTTVAESRPNDSLMMLSVRASEGRWVFQSPVVFPERFTARDSLEDEYGSLLVEAAIRPDAASHLIIGGLPRSRLPLLLGLMLLTLGVGAAALVQTRREQQLARLRDDFISGVSHEFRTPLTQIRVFAELLHDGKLKTEAERTRSASVIDREARRLTHLVENILHFSRLSRASMPKPTLETVDLSETVEDIADSFTRQVSSRASILEAQVAPGSAVRADRVGLHRILANLLDNALKYGGEGQRIRLSVAPDGEMVRISVEDQGPGIPSGDRERIWEPYRRLERDVEGEVQGSGIGLAVVAELASSYGGRTWVEERIGGGSVFVVELPRGSESSQTAAAGSETAE
jgi:signal transduction histidine kinase